MNTKLELSTAYHPQTDGLAERNIQTLENMIRRYFSFGLKYKDKDGYAHDWVSLLTALDIAYDNSLHRTTEISSFKIGRGYNPWMPQDNFKRIYVDMHPAALKFADMLKKATSYGASCIEGAVNYNKSRWDKTQTEPTFKMGDPELESTMNFINLRQPRKLQDSIVHPFVVTKLHGRNAVEVILTADIEGKHPVFPVSLLKP